MYEWKQIEETAGEVNNTKAYVTNYETSHSVLNGCYACPIQKRRVCMSATLCNTAHSTCADLKLRYEVIV
jgi:hypothetical protein